LPHTPHPPASASRPPSLPLSTTHFWRPAPQPVPRRASSTCRIVIAHCRRTIIEKLRRQHHLSPPPVQSRRVRYVAWHPQRCLAEAFQAKRRIDRYSRSPL